MKRINEDKQLEGFALLTQKQRFDLIAERAKLMLKLIGWKTFKKDVREIIR